MIRIAVIARNIRLIEEMIIASYAGMAYHVERNAHGTPPHPHHGFSLLISVKCASVEHYPRVYCTQMSGGH